MKKKNYKVHRSLLFIFAVVLIGSIVFLSVISRQPLLSSADVLSAGPDKDYAPGQILVKFKSNVDKAKKDKFLSDYKLKEKSEIEGIGVKVLELPSQGTEKEYEKSLKANKNIEFAQLNYKYKPVAVPNDPSYPNQWHLPKISAPGAWDKTWGSSNIIIAILDTGVYPTHEDLQAKMVAGWNTYDNTSDTHDVYGHGTTVAGSATAITNNALGVAGVCGNCKLMPMRISDPQGYGYSDTVSRALTWAADHGARVANTSYAFSDDYSATQAAKYFVNKGGLVTSSAGNDNSRWAINDNPYIITVAASDGNDNRCSFSNWGPVIDVIAPGSGILSTANWGSYRTASGTSFSAPITAGVIGMIFSANPGLTPAQAESILETSADDKGTVGWDEIFGWGRVNVQKAVEAALAGPQPDTQAPTATFTTPTNGQTISNTIAVKVNGKDNIGMSAITLDMDGVNYPYTSTQTLSATEVNYTFNIDTNAVTNGNHTLTAKAYDTSSNVGTTSITVNVANVLDTTAPTVSITSPANGTSLRGSKVTVQATAADNVAVTSVEIYIDGALQRILYSAPYSYSWNIKKVSAGTHTIYAKAYDARGNVGTSSIVTVTR